MQRMPGPVIYDPRDEVCEKNKAQPRLYTKYIFQHGTDIKTISDEIFDDEEHKGAVEEIRENEQQLSDPTIYTQYETGDRLKNEVFPRIVFLGTGSASSQVHRNSTAILVHIS